jgi:hypothetical protein
LIQLRKLRSAAKGWTASLNCQRRQDQTAELNLSSNSSSNSAVLSQGSLSEEFWLQIGVIERTLKNTGCLRVFPQESIRFPKMKMVARFSEFTCPIVTWIRFQS